MGRQAEHAEAPTGRERPVLDLSGPRLTRSFESLVGSSEDHGGVEAYISGLAFKTGLFRETLAPERLANLDRETFAGLCAFIAPVRRRFGPWLAETDFADARERVARLLAGGPDESPVDGRIGAFCDGFPADRKHRWVRDFAAELLHFSDPERYPLMTRWVWDRKANTGVLREIWFAENVDSMTIDVPDTYATFLVLREELSQFLSDNGVFRDVLFYVDLLLAQVYGEYICEQGGTYLKTEFSSGLDPMEYTRRMLGLDGVDPDTGRTRAKLPGGVRLTLDALDKAP